MSFLPLQSIYFPLFSSDWISVQSVEIETHLACFFLTEIFMYIHFLNVNKRLLDIFKVFAAEWHIAKYAVKVRKFRSNIEIKLIERQEWPKRNGTSDLLIIEVDETVK